MRRVGDRSTEGTGREGFRNARRQQFAQQLHKEGLRRGGDENAEKGKRKEKIAFRGQDERMGDGR